MVRSRGGNINVHWLSWNGKNGAFCFYKRHLLKYILDIDGLKAVDLAVKSILNYGVNKRLKKICDEINTYSQKIKEEAITDKGNFASDSL